MSTHIYYLSEAENKLVNLKAEGFSSKHILANCPIPLIGFHMFTADVKRKTGIQGKDHQDYREFLNRYNEAISGSLTTPEQTRAMRSSLEGDTLSLNISRDELQAILDAACKAAGIFTRDERARKFAMRLYLALFRFNGNPLDTLETQFLRGMA